MTAGAEVEGGKGPGDNKTVQVLLCHSSHRRPGNDEREEAGQGRGDTYNRPPSGCRLVSRTRRLGEGSMVCSL